MNRDIKIKAIAFGVLAGTLMSSWPARANTIFLQCPGAPSDYADTLTVDLTNNTVNNHSAKKINKTAIDWQHDVKCGDCTSSNPGTATQIYHLDRTTGNLAIHDEFHMQDGTGGRNGPFTYHCAVGHAPATKF
ncbi:MAG TPA: hypothetical protein VII37_05430 [Candidatus Acidoferrum sp.]